MSHTPGPWAVHPLDRRCVIDTRAMDSTEGMVIADVRSWHDTGDAQLIAAAPDLLDALQEYMAQFGQALEAHRIPFGEAQQKADSLARAAIAKAEGK